MEFLEKKVLSEKDDDNPDPTPTDPLLSESIPLENLNSTSKPRRSCPEVYRNSSTVTSPKRKIPLKSAISAPLIHELALECSQSSRNKTVEIVPKTDPEEPNYNQRFVPRLYASRIGTLPVAVYPAWLLRVLCVAVSIAVGLISFLWFFVLIELALIPSGVIGGTVALLLLVFLNLGNRFQCSGALVGPLFGTKHGRIVLLTLVSSILLAGPVSNIVVNANEITKGFSCVSDAVKNETQVHK